MYLKEEGIIYDAHLQQTLPFHLKAQVEECFTILWQDVKRPPPDTKLPSSSRPSVPPRKFFQIGRGAMQHDFIRSVKPLQMSLSFMYDMKKNETLFNKVSSGKLKLLRG